MKSDEVVENDEQEKAKNCRKMEEICRHLWARVNQRNFNIDGNVTR